MSDDTRDYLKKKAEQLNLGREDLLAVVQSELDRLYPGQTKVLSLNSGVLRIITPSSAVASELRLRQVELKNRLPEGAVSRLAISIRSFT